MHNTLELVLILLAAAVLIVALLRLLRLPSLVGYMAAGVVIGPHAWGLVPDTEESRYLAEFGVVFLMFSIGLEFSLPQLKAMRHLVFGLGGLQMGVTALAVLVIALAAGLDWRAGLALGGILAMSSTAIVSRLLAERYELQSRHGQSIVGVLLFQDLAVVPLLILVPALARGDDALATTLGLAVLKAAGALALILFFGQRLMRPWFALVAARKTPELFMLNVFLVTLGLAWFTQRAELSLALGAFLAGVLISETEYRHQVEADIRPFRDVLLGLFFITMGMQLDPAQVMGELPWVLAATLVLVLGKLAIVAGLARLMGASTADAWRVGLSLAQAGEFGLVLLALATTQGLIPGPVAQVVLAAMLLSMVAAPLVIQHSDALVRRLCASEWMSRAAELHAIAATSFGREGHVIICGYGRSGQILARLLDQEQVPSIALDLDPVRVKQAAAAGESVVYGDAGRLEVLMAAGLSRARMVVVTYADVPSALKVLAVVRQARPGLPVVVRTLDDSQMEPLIAAGAQEVVPEVLEGSLMLASHALMLLGVPPSRVVKRVREVRAQRYRLLKAFFLGLSEAGAEEGGETVQPRLYTVTIPEQAPTLGRTLAELDLDSLGVEVTAVRRHGVRGLDPGPELRLEAGDSLILMGLPDDLALAELRLTRG
ncbi:monovalent cation:proton antiporter-2 (CPA2) family protein [Thiobacter aerophilum]|uniref:Monovalent cation:proton antiporter-2 (CPA2) family protein n=1 Tax=Thiobacter aerophilum TaxID=3121275 RepID=A0ABV0EC73_9BURK